MDNNRTLLAVALSMVVLLAWTYFFSPQPQPQPQAVAPTQADQPATAQAPAPQTPQGTPATGMALPQVAAAPAQGRTLTVATPLYTAEINATGGVLESFALAKYHETIEPDSPNINLISANARAKAPLGLLWNGQPTWNRGTWSTDAQNADLAPGESATLTFVCELPEATLTRVLTFSADSYLIDEAVTVTNSTPSQLLGRLGFTLASSGLSAADDSYNPTRVAYRTVEAQEEEGDTDELQQGWGGSGAVQWGGVLSNYFMLTLVPLETPTTFRAMFTNGVYTFGVQRDGLMLAPQTAQTVHVDYYLGPKVEQRLAAMPNDLAMAIDYGMFGFIAKPLLQLMNWLYGYVGNYGTAIILLTVIIKIVFWPLSHKSYKSMNQMKKLQPMMTKIREKYGDDRQRMNQEMMQLYKTYKVNPMGGCMPMLLQIPVFFGLYQALLGAIELRHAPFIAHVPFTDIVWLADLSAKDPFYVTPIVMGATMFLQQKLTPAPGDPTQQKIMMFLPLVFTFVFLNFPAGLVIYWLVNNVLSIAQQWWLMRKA